jgi:hypothetical protein
VEAPPRRRAVKVLIPVCALRSEGLFDELIDPGIEVRLGLGLNFRLGPPEAYGNGVPCHTWLVPHFSWTRKWFLEWPPAAPARPFTPATALGPSPAPPSAR